MTTQNYFIVENNVVTNVVMWDGNTQSWTPPIASIQLPQASTTVMVWEPVLVLNPETQKNVVTDWVLTVEANAGDIGFTWNGSVLTTNAP